jgi:signal transduction histidine kinase
MELRWHFALSTIVTAAAVLSFGLYALWKNPRGRLNQVWAAYNLVIGVWAVGQTIQVTTNDLHVADVVTRLFHGFGVFWFTPLLFHLIAVLAGVERRYRRPVVLSYLIALGWLSLSGTSLVFDVPRWRPGLGYYTTAGPLYSLFLAGWIGQVLVGQWMMRQCMRRTSDVKKWHQLNCLFWSSVFGYAGGICNYLPIYDVLIWPYTPYGTYAVAAYNTVAAYAVIRYQLLDIRVVIRRGVVYSGLIAWITALYLVTILVIERGFQSYFGYRSLVGSTIVALLVAVFFNPIRERLQAFVDRALLKATPAELADQRERLLAEVRKTEQMKAVSALAAGLVHEIRNPLATIKTFTDHLLTRGADGEFRARFHRIVGAEVERISAITHRLLEFAKPAPPTLTLVDLVPLIDQTLEFLGNELVERQVQVVRRYDAHGIVRADSKQLKQVFLNLLLNSLQAVNGHGRVEISTRYVDGQLEACFADNGCGIAPEHLVRLFEPFFTTKSTGAGLGLAVVRGIIEEHGGKIAVESRQGEGTLVRIVLPAEPSPAMVLSSG